MKILILNWRDIKNPLSGGAEISLFEHVKYWKKNGASIIWFSSSFKKAESKEEIEGIRFIRKGSHYTVHFWALLFYLKGKLGKPDVIIDCFHFIPFFTPFYIRERRVRIIALINEVAGNLWFSNIFLPFAYIGYLIEPLIIKFYRNKQFITGSESASQELIRLGVKRDNIFVIHHGLRVEEISSDIQKESIPTILFLGRISEDKGIKDALKVMVLIGKEIRDIKFWFVGREERKGNFSRLINGIVGNKQNLKVKVTFFGYVDEKKKFELLKRAWILIHPSQKEGWGLTVIEAASQGTPTVGYNVEGLRDSIIDEKTGILVDPNPSSLAKAVRKLINDKDLYNHLSREAIIWSSNFSWGKSGKKSWGVINCYEQKYK